MNEKRQKLNEAYDTHKKENYKSSSSSKVSKIFPSASFSSIQSSSSSSSCALVSLTHTQKKNSSGKKKLRIYFRKSAIFGIFREYKFSRIRII